MKVILFKMSLHRRFVFIFLSFSLMLSLVLTGCSTPSTQPKAPVNQPILPKPIISEPSQSNQDLLQQAIQIAKNNQDWPAFIDKSQQLWQIADIQNQMAIEYIVYATLKKLPKTTLETLSEQAQSNHNVDMQDWLDLVKAMQIPKIWHKTTLRDLQNFDETAIYQQHLLPQLLNFPIEEYRPQNIGILLPLTGQYASIGQQIKAGILKHYFKDLSSSHSKPLTLRFYDTANLDQVVSTYQQAIEDGADKIIGPLQKPAIALLAAHHANKLLILNQVDNVPFEQFPYLPTDEAQQIVAQLQAQHYKHIGILTNDKPGNIQLASKIQRLWNQQQLLADDNTESPTIQTENPVQPPSDEQMNIDSKITTPYQSELKIYPSHRPNLKDAFGQVVNETLSQARKNNLRWLLNEKLFFTPRTRQDLNALVMIGSERNIAVFKPQLKYFNLKLPIFASANISPSRYQQIKPNLDLKQVIFPTYNTVLHPGNISSSFEAFGWDSLTSLIHPEWFGENLCYNDGKRGRLSRDGNVIKTFLVWAYYNKNGVIQSYPPEPIAAPQAPLLTTDKPTENRVLSRINFSSAQ